MGLQVLIVDDSQIVRAVITKSLQLAEVPVDALFEASNGQEALDVLRERKIDLVFADINMPVMNGVEMVRRLSEQGLLKTLPVIMTSTDGSSTRIEQLKSMGVSEYLRKPFTPEGIRQAVERVVGVQHEC